MQEVFVGFDIGATTIKGGAVDREGKVLSGQDLIEVPSHLNKSVEATLNQCEVMLNTLSALPGLEGLAAPKRTNLAAIGLGMAGIANRQGQIVVSANGGAHWKNISPAEQLIERVGRPVVFENDANAAAFSEFQAMLVDHPDLAKSNGLLITLGSGVGGGIIINGELYRGSNGNAGEIGHIPIKGLISYALNETAMCGCGTQGCAEQSGSIRFLKNEVRALMEQNSLDPQLTRLAADITDTEQKVSRIATSLLSVAEKGPGQARDLILTQAVNVGITLGTVNRLLDLDWNVVGGGVAQRSDEFKELFLLKIREGFSRGSFNHQHGTAIFMARLGDHAGYRGMAELARRRFASQNTDTIETAFREENRFLAG